MTFNVTLGQPVFDGNLSGDATAEGTFTAQFAVNDPHYPSTCRQG
jgi:hypothetical protein